MENDPYTLLDIPNPYFELRNKPEPESRLPSLLGSLAGVAMLGLTAYAGVETMGNHQATVMVRTWSQVDILHKTALLPITAEEYIDKNRDIISQIEQEYDLPPGVLLQLAYQELGSKDKKTFLGMEAFSEQFIKAFVNDIRAQFGDEGDMSRNGASHLGSSFGLLNVKPGLINQTVIEGIKNDELRQQLLAQYDCAKGHASDEQIRHLATKFDVSLELVALWKPYLLDYAQAQDMSEEEIQRLFALLISTFPQEEYGNKENHYYWLKRDGFAVPKGSPERESNPRPHSYQECVLPLNHQGNLLIVT